MFNKILIANRGEIAVRIIRACHEMNIAAVAVFSEADSEALHVQTADEAVCIGGAQAKDSYLNSSNIISAACLTGAQAIHPGFGFLSENGTFAAMCADCGIRFIGPSAETIAQMGDKANARKLMRISGVPVIPGSDGLVADAEEACELARDFGFPVMLKASAGGGGKGIRIAHTEDELRKNYEAARLEAKAAFADDSLYLEKVIENARHIEVQILADNFGNIVHLGERDCSLQVRNQKVLEEAPSLAINNELRKKLGAYALTAAKACEYRNAGTIEFLLDKKENIYFMEMNTRVQVEHPVTEMVTGVDIVKEQIKIASGEKLSFGQEEVRINGFAIECRLNAKSAGKIDYLFLPGGPGVRVDSGIFSGCTIPPYYDSMLAKVIAGGCDRSEAIAKMKRCLNEVVISGVETNIDFQLELLSREEYLNGDFTTAFLNN